MGFWKTDLGTMKPRKLWLAVGILTVLVFVGETAGLLPGPRFMRGTVVFLSMFSSPVILLMFLFPVSIILAVYFLVRAVKRGPEERRNALSKLAASLAFPLLLFLVLHASYHVRWSAFARAGRNGEPIIAAVLSYYADKGCYPENLHDLVPAYLEAIPSTGLMAYPDFRYRKGAENIKATYHLQDREDLMVTWELMIDCPRGLSFDKFVYWPEENYPETIPSYRVDRIGKWAYLWE